MPQQPPDKLAFDDVVIDFAARRLWRAGAEQPLEPKAFAVLEVLAGSPGRALSRDEILDAVWGHRHVTQSVLNRILSLLRQALGEDAQNPRVLHTVHGVGYRFDMPATVPPGIAAPTARARWPWFAAAAVLAFTVIAAAAWLRKDVEVTQTRSAAPATAALPSLAVLPFADLSQSHDQEYLADGLAEEILDQLSQVPGLRVVGRSSSFSSRARARTCAPSARSWAWLTCSKAACAKPVSSCASRRS